MAEAGPAEDPKGPARRGWPTGRRLLETRPDLAPTARPRRSSTRLRLRAILVALRLLGVAKRFQGDAAGARTVLEDLARTQPRWAAAHYELGLTLAGC